MPELDLGPAIEAAVAAYSSVRPQCGLEAKHPWHYYTVAGAEKFCRGASSSAGVAMLASAFIRAALPELERAIREKVAREIDAHNATLHPGDDVFQDEGKAYLTTAAAIVRGQIGGPDA